MILIEEKIQDNFDSKFVLKALGKKVVTDWCCFRESQQVQVAVVRTFVESVGKNFR